MLFPDNYPVQFYDNDIVFIHPQAYAWGLSFDASENGHDDGVVCLNQDGQDARDDDVDDRNRGILFQYPGSNFRFLIRAYPASPCLYLKCISFLSCSFVFLRF